MLAIKPHIPTLRKYSYGKHIISKQLSTRAMSFIAMSFSAKLEKYFRKLQPFVSRTTRNVSSVSSNCIKNQFQKSKTEQIRLRNHQSSVSTTAVLKMRQRCIEYELLPPNFYDIALIARRLASKFTIVQLANIMARLDGSPSCRFKLCHPALSHCALKSCRHHARFGIQKVCNVQEHQSFILLFAQQQLLQLFVLYHTHLHIVFQLRVVYIIIFYFLFSFQHENSLYHM